jgi:hypothetical protein
MLRRIASILTTPLRFIWRVTGKPVYQRLFGVQFQATINRLNSVLGELNDVRAELDEFRARQEELDSHVRTVLASHWDTTALTRRLATIEERIAAPEQYVNDASRPFDDELRDDAHRQGQPRPTLKASE